MFNITNITFGNETFPTEKRVLMEIKEQIGLISIKLLWFSMSIIILWCAYMCVEYYKYVVIYDESKELSKIKYLLGWCNYIQRGILLFIFLFAALILQYSYWGL